ncbi:unnamed protein product [Orchesella dallaii]|uniref:PKS/mFAS DH domain-containing protein n=1 Tax=Orchesella dallaii TaxID=48710 RepID=A0ABP1QS96_9HEXA
MVVHESQVWITSVIDDQEANKAVVLAASLRKVLTKRKIVVIFSPNISKDTRDLLRQKFDLTVLIDENKPDGVDAREFAKIFAFSFNVFSKCVYLSASTLVSTRSTCRLDHSRAVLVLQNCDEIFDKYNTSLTTFSNNENGVDVDTTSVFVFTPSSSYYNEMRKLFSNGQVWNATTSAKGSTERFSESFGKWLLNQNASSGFLEEKYNCHLSLMDEKEIYNGLQSDLVIINFIDVHPIEMADKLMENSITTLGIVESFVVNTWMQIYMEEFRMKTSCQSLEGLVHDFQVPRRPILLKDLKIEAPLGIDDSIPTLMQTIIDLVDNKDDDSATTAGYHVKVHHFHKSDDELSGSSHWVSHASAMYVPFVADDKIVNMANIDIKNIQQTWEISTTSSDLYRKLPEVGLRFGPTFQSLLNGWVSKSDQSFLTAVKVPEDVARYIAHPILIDAMIQASLLWSKSKDRLHKKLNVPVSIGEFTWLRSSDLEGRFIYCNKDDTDNIRAVLVDEVGTPLMTMSGVDFVETTASVVESMIHQQVSQSAEFWEEIWRHRPGPLECRFGHRKVEGQIFSNDVLKMALELNELGDEDQKAYEHLNKATVYLFINALYQLGWSIECGDSFTIEEIITKLGIASSFSNFIKFFVKCMIEEGYVVENSADSFMISSPLPTKANISAYLRVPTQEAPRADFKIIYEVGNKLSEILSEKTHALAVLFPDSQMTLADSFYETNHGIITRSSDLLLSSIIARCLETVANLKPQTKLRILEVGAGTAIPCYGGVHSNVIALASHDYYVDGIPGFLPEIWSAERVWIIFGDDSLLCKSLIGKLKNFGRQVIVLTTKESLAQLKQKDFLSQIVSMDVANKRSLEGAIYLWGLVSSEERDQTAIAEPYLYLCQYLTSVQKPSPRLITVTNGLCSVNESKYQNPAPSTLFGISKVLRTDTSISAKCIDVVSDEPLEEQINHIFTELWYQGPWGQVGIATDIELPGVRPLSTQQGLHALDVNIRANRIQTGVINVDSFSMLAKFCHGISKIDPIQ